ncbi:MAG: thioredoxin domain-containing protein [Oligoflexia bacterium]|nr:thioredoxin domain-containing protein [Oligoflexia bacterium]
MTRYSVVGLGLVLSFLMGCSPSQEQVDKAVRKIMDEREAEKDRFQKYLEEYARTKGGAPGQPPTAPQREAPPSVEEMMKNPKKIEVGSSPWKGTKNSKVTIIEFSDFQCPFCNAVSPTINSLLKKYDGKLKIVFKHRPLPFHNNAKIAAQASMAAHKQGKFWQMHDVLFANNQKLDRPNLVEYAKQIGLNIQKFEKDLDDPEMIKQIESESNWAAQNGLGGTPSFLINGVTLVGAVPEDRFAEIIDKFLK